MKTAASTLQETALRMKPARVNNNIVPSHKKDPFVLKKRAAAKRLLENVSLPETLTRKK